MTENTPHGRRTVLKAIGAGALASGALTGSASAQLEACDLSIKITCSELNPGEWDTGVQCDCRHSDGRQGSTAWASFKPPSGERWRAGVTFVNLFGSDAGTIGTTYNPHEGYRSDCGGLGYRDVDGFGHVLEVFIEDQSGNKFGVKNCPLPCLNGSRYYLTAARAAQNPAYIQPIGGSSGIQELSTDEDGDGTCDNRCYEQYSVRLYDESCAPSGTTFLYTPPGVGLSGTRYYPVTSTGSPECDFAPVTLGGGLETCEPPAVFPDPIAGFGPPQDLDGDGLYEDVTGDGEVNGRDVAALARIWNAVRKGDLTLTPAQEAAFDFNGDEVFDEQDLAAFEAGQQ